MNKNKYKNCIVGTQSGLYEFWLVKGNDWFDFDLPINYFSYCPICGKKIDVVYFNNFVHELQKLADLNESYDNEKIINLYYEGKKC